MDSPPPFSRSSSMSHLASRAEREQFAGATSQAQFYKSLRSDARPFRAGTMQRSPSGHALKPLAMSPTVSPSRPRTTQHRPFGSGPVVLSPLASSGELGRCPSGSGGLGSDRTDLARLYNLHSTPTSARPDFGGNEPGNPSFYPLGLGRSAYSTRC